MSDSRYANDSTERKQVNSLLREVEDFVREFPTDYEESITATLKDLHDVRFHIGEMSRIISQLERERDSLRAMWIEMSYHDQNARIVAFRNWGLEHLIPTSCR